MERIERRYYKNGALLMECRVRDGLYDGVCRVFYPGGNLKSSRTFDMGMLVGEHLEYYEDGSLMWRYPTSDGYYNGVAEEFYEDGGIKTRILFVNGFAEDVTTHYDEDGQVISRIPYKHGEPDGIATYYEGDKVSMTLPYENGKRQGFSMYYDEDGDIYRTSIFIDNQYCGSRQMSYYEKGVVSCECDIEGYLPDGEAVYLHRNGKVASKVRFKKGVAVDGRYAHFDENGNEDSYIVYKNNTATRYDMKGEFLEDWVNYRHHPNGLCHRCLPDGGTEAFYMCEGSECDSHDEFLEENFEIVADRCRERFGKKRPDLDQALYVQFFGEQYRMIAESPLAQNEFCNYEELDVCDIMAIDDDTFFRYMARDLLLRLRLPNDGETEKKLTCNLKEFVGAR
ncbi:toxin-antitoxin system YwqK family antitoxin [uncultured Fibrobacter sp.]|uniref:toxin-antitoxin system YwqK family antitoxin n=1 Tax=uncultured Fibrobacter sp. TaxID=261512 RepID=UPI0025F0D79F|nr:toxin-antitoxin system YwqK family antitoxin [uncultured Fibrobacter sp.]